jgi:hypothetical protein
MIRKLATVVVILMVVLLLSHYQFGLFESYNWLTAKKDISNQRIQLVIYGELDPNEQLRNKIAVELGFQFFRPTGCVVDQPFINGVNGYNQVVTAYLNEQSPDWEQQLNVRIEQLKSKVIFDQSEPFVLLNFSQFADYQSSDPDTSQCANWKLTNGDITNILKSTIPMSGPEWHHLFGHYPCVYRGTLTQNERKFEFAINAGSWVTISSDTTIYYGDLDGTFELLFLDKVWDEEE